MTKSRTKKVTRFFAIFMATILLAMCVPTNVFGSNDAQPLSDFKPAIESTAGESLGATVNEGVSVIEGDVIGEYVEDVSRREENVKHFALPDGTYTAIVYPTAVHRKDADGVWQDIDNDLALSSVKGTQKYATTDSRVSFAQSFSPSAELMTLSENGYSISMSLISDSKNESVMRASTESFGLASVTNAVKKELPKTDVKLEDVAKVDNKSSIVYNNIRANTDIEYILDGNDVKENIIVKAALSEYEYTFDLRLDGLVAILNENGSISINDAETGAAKYMIPAPYMYDANGYTSYAVEYTLIEVSSGRYLLSVIADKTWINATGREFPVTIDPTITSTFMMSDTYVSDTSPNANYFSSADLLVGDGYTALMLLDFPSLPTGALLTEVYLHMNYYFSPTNFDGVLIGAYQITSSWSEEFATYNNMPSISSTQLSSIMLMGDMGTEVSPCRTQMSIIGAATNWYNGSANYGIAIKYESGIGTAKIKSYDSGYNTREFISVSYYIPLPTSGGEITYNTSLWNYSPVVTYTNCYAYSLNNQVYPNTNTLWYMQPGESAGYRLRQNEIDAETVFSYVLADSIALRFTFREIGKYETCSTNSYKVALVIDPQNDYHWYRQNSDGTWSHKLGSYPVTNLDASDKVIYDPEEANRNHGNVNYTVFVGFYEVTPLNNFYNSNTAMRNLDSSTFDTITFSQRKATLPDYSDTTAIEKGMLYSEVTSLVGLPQRMRTFGVVVVEYDLSCECVMLVEYVRNSQGQYVVESVTYENLSNIEVIQ